jgi:hypothetical protein
MRDDFAVVRSKRQYKMDTPLEFAVICLVMGTVAAATIPSRLRAEESGTGFFGRLLGALIVLSLVIFLWSLGGTGIVLAAHWPVIAHVLEGAAVVSGGAALLLPLVAALYAGLRFLFRRRAGA